MKVYVVIMKCYFDDIYTEIKCICKNRQTAMGKMKEYANEQVKEQFSYENWKITDINNDKYVLNSDYESMEFRVVEYEVI